MPESHEDKHQEKDLSPEEKDALLARTLERISAEQERCWADYNTPEQAAARQAKILRLAAEHTENPLYREQLLQRAEAIELQDREGNDRGRG